MWEDNSLQSGGSFLKNSMQDFECGVRLLHDPSPRGTSSLHVALAPHRPQTTTRIISNRGAPLVSLCRPPVHDRFIDEYDPALRNPCIGCTWDHTHNAIVAVRGSPEPFYNQIHLSTTSLAYPAYYSWNPVS